MGLYIEFVEKDNEVVGATIGNLDLMDTESGSDFGHGSAAVVAAAVVRTQKRL